MASTYLDTTAANAILKELYVQQSVEEVLYKKAPYFALIRKFTGFVGKNLPVPLQTNTSQGASSVFATAQANQVAPELSEFLLTRKKDYSLATIDAETLYAAESDAGSFIRTAKLNVDSALRVSKQRIATQLFRAGTGSRAQVSTATAPSTGVITLQNPADIVQFERNQTLQANATDGGATPRAALGYVIAVDRAAGTLTVASSGLGGTAATPSGWTTSDYLLVQGDNNAVISGKLAWIPTTAPTGSDSFYGVNRSIDPVRLAGVRLNVSAESVEEGLIDLVLLTAREGASSDRFWSNYQTYGALEKALGAKVQYVDLESSGEAKIMFRGIRINGPDGEINCMPDRNCPALTGFLDQSDTWQLDSLHDAPFIQRAGDGLDMLRVSTADAAEMRIAMYGNQECNAPGWNAVGVFGV